MRWLNMPASDCKGCYTRRERGKERSFFSLKNRILKWTRRNWFICHFILQFLFLGNMKLKYSKKHSFRCYYMEAMVYFILPIKTNVYTDIEGSLLGVTGNTKMQNIGFFSFSEFGWLILVPSVLIIIAIAVISFTIYRALC